MTTPTTTERPKRASTHSAMSKQKFSPWARYACDSLELAKLMFTHDDNAAAKEIGVTVTEWQRWKTGEEPVPKLVWLYLKQRKQIHDMGPWKGYQVDGDRIISPWGESLHVNEWHELREYRRAHRLAQEQADLIERLMAERDFYRENCHRQAKFGLMLNRIFR